MARTIHDPAFRASLETRLKQLQPGSRPAWGKMSVDQMLWHLNQGLGMALGRVTPAAERAPIPRSVIKWIVLNLPWPKNAPTGRAFVPKAQYDFDAERARCLEYVGELAARPIDAPQPPHPMFGGMTGLEQSRLQAKHLNHHLTQFGV
jgi:hypothetical protein